MTSFKPTYLYIKTHVVTGLKYFGKTTRNPLSYAGSGKYWKRHINKHGNICDTEILGIYHDVRECTIDAVWFSETFDIVNSDEWANLIVENGMDGAPVGHAPTFSPDQEWKDNNSRRAINNWNDPEWRKETIRRQKIAANDPTRKDEYSRIAKQQWEGNETRKAAQSKVALQVWEDYKEKIMENFKRPKSAEHKAKISAALSGTPFSL